MLSVTRPLWLYLWGAQVATTYLCGVLDQKLTVETPQDECPLLTSSSTPSKTSQCFALALGLFFLAVMTLI